MGQYTQVDPIGLFGENPTLYGYVFNPFVEIDQFGLQCSNLDSARFPKSNKDFKDMFGMDKRTFHQDIKETILKDARANPDLKKWLNRYRGNPDIGVNPDGFIILKKDGKEIVTDLLIDWFI